ncbi:hypothetical protein [Pararhizobium sp. DWP3-4]|uniref:hypothetical protein n=1 Tax=Pararhizobium sp. DWP3-4 TaxID=2804565 RepID=UPI003CEA40A3
MSDLLQRTAEGIQERMDEILANFKPGAKVTVLVRTPDKPTADFCMTDDNLWEVTAMLKRRMVDAGYPVVSSEPLAFISQKAFGQLIADRSSEYLMTVPRDKPGPMEVALFTWPTPAPEANPPVPDMVTPTLDRSALRTAIRRGLEGESNVAPVVEAVLESVETYLAEAFRNAASPAPKEISGADNRDACGPQLSPTPPCGTLSCSDLALAYCRSTAADYQNNGNDSTPPATRLMGVENAALRKIISDAAAALPNGAYIHPQASVGFMEGLPKEIAMVCADLKTAASNTPPTPNVAGEHAETAVLAATRDGGTHGAQAQNEDKIKVLAEAIERGEAYPTPAPGAETDE